MHRIGIGYDIHRLIRRRKLILGGINIPSSRGLWGHSDADVLVHAVCDALLGACAQGDIGEHFPNSHPAYRDISSMQLLKKVNAILKKLRFTVSNIDTVILAQAPNLGKYKAKMSKNIAKALSLSSSCVNVKATTTEGLGPIGKGAAISAYAVALIKKK